MKKEVTIKMTTDYGCMELNKVLHPMAIGEVEYEFELKPTEECVCPPEYTEPCHLTKPNGDCKICGRPIKPQAETNDKLIGEDISQAEIEELTVDDISSSYTLTNLMNKLNELIRLLKKKEIL